MSRRRQAQSGFTAVELLITLFIAASFLIAGYQLFDIVIRDGAEARAEAKASNIAYDYLRRHADTATNPCKPGKIISEKVANTDGLINIVASVQISCPRIESPTISRVEATVAYGAEGKSVTHATFIDRSKGAVPNQAGIISGLVGWWKLNNSGASSAAAHTLTLTGTIFIPNRLGVADSAATTGGGKRMVTSTTDALTPSTLTLSLWVNPSHWTTSAADFFVSKRTSAANGLALGRLGSTNALFLDCGGSGQRFNTNFLPPTNTWTHVTATCESGKVALYVNGALLSQRASNSITALNTTAAFTIGEDSSNPSTTTYPFHGSVDDVRLYNRVLSENEIAQVAGESQ